MISKSTSYMLAMVTAVVSAGFVLPFETPKKNKHVSIGEYINEKKLDVTLTSLGGHSGGCIRMDLTNQTNDTLFIRLEPGRRLVSDDTTEQDIFVVKEQLVSLLPKAKKPITAFGFCCESNMHSPDVNKKFSVGYMAPPEWIELAEYLNKNTFDKSAMQEAVWVMSNNHQVSSINDKNQVKTEKLRKKVAKLKGVEVPWYSLFYEEEQGRVFSGKHNQLMGILEFTLRESSVVVVQVRNINGDVVATPSQGSQYTGGEQKYILDLNVKGWPNGKYTIFVFQNGMRQVMKKEFTL